MSIWGVGSKFAAGKVIAGLNGTRYTFSTFLPLTLAWSCLGSVLDLVSPKVGPFFLSRVHSKNMPLQMQGVSPVS